MNRPGKCREPACSGMKIQKIEQNSSVAGSSIWQLKKTNIFK